MIPAKDVNIAIELMPESLPKTIDAPFIALVTVKTAFSTMSCLIIDDKPIFLPVEDILKANVDQNQRTIKKAELQIKLNMLMEQWFYKPRKNIH